MFLFLKTDVRRKLLVKMEIYPARILRPKKITSEEGNLPSKDLRMLESWLRLERTGPRYLVHGHSS
jgi:hypothetical protein